MPYPRCPYCFSRLYNPLNPGQSDPINFIWSHDPISTPIIDENNQSLLQYKGCSQSIITEILELQQNRVGLELEVLAIEDRTTFSSINIDGIFQITAKHIAELRWSTEKILQAVGISKEDYFNYNEEGTEYNIGQHKLEWADALPKINSQSEWDNYTYELVCHYLKNHFQIKMIHLEDLRHYIPTGWLEPWIGHKQQYVTASAPPEEGNILESTFLSKHTWYANTWAWAQGGLVTANASTNLLINKNHFLATSFAHAGTDELHLGHTGGAISRHYILCEDINNPEIQLNDKLNLIFTNLGISYTSIPSGAVQLVQNGWISWRSGVHILINTSPLETMPGWEWLFGYYIGSAHENPGFDVEQDFIDHRIKWLSSLNGINVKRNIYDDYYSVMGSYPGEVSIENIVIYIKLDVTFNGGWYAEGRTGFSNAASIYFDSIALRNIAKT